VTLLVTLFVTHKQYAMGIDDLVADLQSYGLPAIAYRTDLCLFELILAAVNSSPP